MDSELQDALDNMSRYGFPAIDTPREWVVTDVIVEAARKVANPDYEVAYKEWKYFLVQHPSGPHRDAIKTAVNAALGIGGTDIALGITEDT